MSRNSKAQKETTSTPTPEGDDCKDAVVWACKVCLADRFAMSEVPPEFERDGYSAVFVHVHASWELVAEYDFRAYQDEPECEDDSGLFLFCPHCDLVPEDAPKWWLLDVAQIGESYLPLRVLRLGQSVKLVFTDGGIREHMWVHVTGRLASGHFTGLLDNEPYVFPLPDGRTRRLDVHQGDAISFLPVHVIALEACQDPRCRECGAAIDEEGVYVLSSNLDEMPSLREAIRSGVLPFEQHGDGRHCVKRSDVDRFMKIA